MTWIIDYDGADAIMGKNEIPHIPRQLMDTVKYINGECPRCGQSMFEVPDPMPEGWVCFLCKEKDEAAQRLSPSSNRPEHPRVRMMYDTYDTPQQRYIRAEQAMRERHRAEEQEMKWHMARFRHQEARRERGLDPGRYHSDFYSKPKVPGTIPTDDAERRRLIEKFKRKNG
jgi:hypothetical protein